MSKKLICYFGGLIDLQEKWLNKIAATGYRLVKAGKLIYEFEECEPNKYQYSIEFVAHKSNIKLNEYKQFLQEFGYNVMTKNINLNTSVGKLRLRPYGAGLGKIATNPGNYNKELLILEKLNDGKPFEIHTTIVDKIEYFKFQRNAYLSLFLLLLILVGWKWVSTDKMNLLIFAIPLIVSLPIIVFQRRIWKYKKQSTINE